MIDWEQKYLDGDTPWNKGAAHPALASLKTDPAVFGRVLVPGCGQGHDVAALAAISAVTEVVGIDIADTAIQEATTVLAREPKARVEKADLFALAPAYRGHFDLVWEHTCFCAIDPGRRNAYVNAVAGVLRPGGHLLAVFFLTPWNSEEENRTQGPPFGCSEEELDRRFAPRFEIVRTGPVAVTYPGREGREQLRLLRRV